LLQWRIPKDKGFQEIKRSANDKKSAAGEKKLADDGLPIDGGLAGPFCNRNFDRGDVAESVVSA